MENKSMPLTDGSLSGINARQVFLEEHQENAATHLLTTTASVCLRSD